MAAQTQSEGKLDHTLSMSFTGAQYCGVEFKNECFCGNNDNYNRFGNLEDDKDCTLLCKGNSSLKCGGNNAIFIYNGELYNHVSRFGHSI